MKRHKQRALAKQDQSNRIRCLVQDLKVNENGIEERIPCSKTFASTETLRKHLLGADGVTTGRVHSTKDIKRYYPKIKQLITRKKDKTRTVGKIHRSFTIAQKVLRIKRGLGADVGRTGKKARKDQEAR